MAGELAPLSPEHVLQDFEGTYIGFSPTDESALGVGEISLTIGESSMSYKWASGLELIEEEIDLSNARELSLAEFEAKLEKGPPISRATRVFNVDGLDYVFTLNPESIEAPTLLVMGGISDLLGPTILFSPSQVEAGHYEKAVRDLEEAYNSPGSVPRLSSNGLAPADLN